MLFKQVLSFQDNETTFFFLLPHNSRTVGFILFVCITCILLRRYHQKSTFRNWKSRHNKERMWQSCYANHTFTNLFLLVSLELLEQPNQYVAFLEQIFIQHSVMKTQTYKKTDQFTCQSNQMDRLERILTRVYIVQNSQNFSGLFPSTCIPKNTTFRKLDLFPSSGEGGEKTPTRAP
jgi:hypothetical protein